MADVSALVAKINFLEVRIPPPLVFYHHQGWSVDPLRAALLLDGVGFYFVQDLLRVLHHALGRGPWTLDHFIAKS